MLASIGREPRQRKEEWGFDGTVVSDLGAITGRNDKSVATGMDMVLYGPTPCNGTDIVEAVKAGILEKSRVNDAVERVLKLFLWWKRSEKKIRLNMTKMPSSSVPMIRLLTVWYY